MVLEKEPSDYESPEIVDYGDLVELTAAQGHGHSLDSVFHAGTDYEHPHYSDA